MPTGQSFSSTAVQATLQGTITSGATSCVVDSVSGWPTTYNFTVVADPGQANQEIWDVTNVTGTTLTITRAVDGSSAQAHSAGAKIVHVGIGRDFREYRAHVDASTSNDTTGHSVHGLQSGSSVVGTTDFQTLASKTLQQPVIVGSGGTLSLPAGPDTLVGRATTDTLTNKTLTSPTINTPTLTGPSTNDLVVTGLTGAVVSSRYVGATAGGPPVAGTFLVGDIVVDTAWGVTWVCVSAGTPGSWRPSGEAVLGVQAPATGSNIVFNSIPSYFTNLRIVGNVNANNATSLQDVQITFNGDNASGNYGFFTGFVNTAFPGGSGNNSINQNMGKCGVCWGNANPEGASFTVDIPQYSNATRWKNLHSMSGATQWNVTSNYNVTFAGCAWHSTAAITSITIQPSGGSGFVAGSTATLLATL